MRQRSNSKKSALNSDVDAHATPTSSLQTIEKSLNDVSATTGMFLESAANVFNNEFVNFAFQGGIETFIKPELLPERFRARPFDPSKHQ